MYVDVEVRRGGEDYFLCLYVLWEIILKEKCWRNRSLIFVLTLFKINKKRGEVEFVIESGRVGEILGELGED